MATDCLLPWLDALYKYMCVDFILQPSLLPSLRSL